MRSSLVWSLCVMALVGAGCGPDKPDEVVSAPPLWSGQPPLKCPGGGRVVYGRALRWCERDSKKHGTLEQIGADGLITLRLTFKDGKADGAWTAYYPGSNIARWSADYTDGQPGRVRHWYPDGAPRCALQYADRKPAGQVTCLTPDDKKFIDEPARPKPAADAPPRGQTAWTPKMMQAGIRARDPHLRAAYDLFVRLNYPMTPLRFTALMSLHPRGAIVGCQMTTTSGPDALLGDMLCRELEAFEAPIGEQSDQLFWIEEGYVFEAEEVDAQRKRQPATIRPPQN